MANFHKGTWKLRENIVSLVVKLLPTLKHVINVYSQKKFHWTMKEAESDARISSFFSAPDQL